MLNENAKKWVEALRSGEFSQTKRLLHDNNGYCCLGVACELAAREGRVGSKNYGTTWFYENEDCFLPWPVKTWLGLASDSGVYHTDENTIRSLAVENDNGSTFSQIADIIESEPEGLFI